MRAGHLAKVAEPTIMNEQLGHVRVLAGD